MIFNFLLKISLCQLATLLVVCLDISFFLQAPCYLLGNSMSTNNIAKNVCHTNNLGAYVILVVILIYLAAKPHQFVILIQIIKPSTHMAAKRGTLSRRLC